VAETPYPRFIYYPQYARPPDWVEPIVEVFQDCRGSIDTLGGKWNRSDKALEFLREGLVEIGFKVEGGKKHSEKLHRPVFFGDEGEPSTKYEIDAYHPDWRVAAEIEAGRSIHGNAIYRDLIRMSLMADCDFAMIAVPLQYEHGRGTRRTRTSNYLLAKDILSGVYGSNRLKLPFQGLLLIGY
jgi:hypothetical protein